MASEVSAALPTLRLTAGCRLVVEALLTAPNASWWVGEIRRHVRLSNSTVNSIMGRLVAAGWLASGLEDPVSGRKPRRYYRFVRGGAEAARSSLEGEGCVTSDSGEPAALPVPSRPELAERVARLEYLIMRMATHLDGLPQDVHGQVAAIVAEIRAEPETGETN